MKMMRIIKLVVFYPTEPAWAHSTGKKKPWPVTARVILRNLKNQISY